MNARLIKETRDLLPAFAGTLPLIVVPQLIWPAAGFGYLALGVACLLMAGSSFGMEFQHRTLSLLLSQPIPRSVLWRDKMLVLGAGMLTSLVVLLVCLAVSGPASGRVEWLTLALIPLCAFCGVPFWTLMLRQGIAGVVSAVGIPSSILAAFALVVEPFGVKESAALVSAMLFLLLIYCALVYWLGYAKFKQLEAVDAPSRELSLPTGWEAFLTRPLTKVSSRLHGPFGTLLKKELHLQQVNHLLAGVFILIAVAGFCLIKRHPGVSAGIVGGDYLVYVLILPLIAGAISVAEERGWGMAEWHLTLPPSALQQWSAKMLAALSTSFVLGLLLPAAMILAGAVLLDPSGARGSLPPAAAICGWVVAQLLVTSVAVFAGSFCKSTLRAILTAFAIIAVGGGICAWLGSEAARIVALRLSVLRQPPVHPPFAAGLLQTLIPLLVTGGLFVMLSVVQWFAWSNFRHCGQPPNRIIVQLLLIFLTLGLLALGIPLVILATLYFVPFGG